MRKAMCRAYLLSESGKEYCHKKAGHKGWHSYAYRWKDNKPVEKVSWRKRQRR